MRIIQKINSIVKDPCTMTTGYYLTLNQYLNPKLFFFNSFETQGSMY